MMLIVFLLRGRVSLFLCHREDESVELSLRAEFLREKFWDLDLGSEMSYRWEKK
jgi:hypothetical protein